MSEATTPAAVQQPYVHVPNTVSPQAQAFLQTMKDPHLNPRFPDPGDLDGWKKLQAWAEADGKARSEPLLMRYKHTVKELNLASIPVLDIRPQDWKDNGKVLVYTHGGAHVMYSAASMLGRAVVAASETGLRVLSVDYTLAPHAKYNQMSDQVVSAIEALLGQGQALEDTAIFGERKLERNIRSWIYFAHRTDALFCIQGTRQSPRQGRALFTYLQTRDRGCCNLVPYARAGERVAACVRPLPDMSMSPLPMQLPDCSEVQR